MTLQDIPKTNEENIIRCERCLLFKPFGRYTKFEIRLSRYKAPSGKIIEDDMGEKRALCIDCMPEVAKKNWDAANCTCYQPHPNYNLIKDPKCPTHQTV